MKKYNHKLIEKTWQKKWDEEGLYIVPDEIKGKENFYTLVEYPYPSGNVHIGHWYAFAVPDMFARYKRMQGFNVLFPIGFDSFGLPAENAAIRNNVDPKEWTYKNIAHMEDQLKSIGASFDWSRKVVTSDPEYYRWTQWLFLALYKKGLAYQGEAVVNWDPVDKTVLANEQVLPDGTAELSGAVVEKKKLKQWFFKITDYAERLLNDLRDLNWPKEIKESQKNWIGKNEGVNIRFKIYDLGFKNEKEIEVFTTRPDTLFGATCIVLAPEHELLKNNELGLSDQGIKNYDEVKKYIETVKNKPEIERTAERQEKTGVELRGVKAVNPATKEEIPIFVADYVLASYGTGAVMAVPAHDERDYEFAKKFNLPIKQVIEPLYIQSTEPGKVVEGLPFDNRDAIIAIVKHWSEEKYIGLKWKKVARGTFITGGVENGQTAEEAAVAEIKEETGYMRPKLISDFGRVHGKFYHVPKKVNRFAHARVLYFELQGDEKEGISQEENEIHEVRWLDRGELQNFLTPDTHQHALRMLFNTQGSYAGEGILTNSAQFNGLTSEEAKTKITAFVGGKKKITYKLRDWIISRQRYWGCPIPIVYDPKGLPHPIPEEHLPWLLPEDVDFKPTGEAPLASSKKLKERVEKLFGKGWRPEYDTMDVFVDSSWYFLRYIDPHNDTVFASKEKLKKWMPIRRYSGGAEHTTVHLLYSRFFHKALFDLGLVNEKEPYEERLNRGIILGTDGRKMSKRWGNVIDPDEQVKNAGADSVRLYLAFIGPYNIPGHYSWDIGGLVGANRFLKKIWSEYTETNNGNTVSSLKKELREEYLLHSMIKKIGEDIEQFKFNTAIATMMKFVGSGGLNNSDAEKEKEIKKTFLKLLAPFAPHIAEELWRQALMMETSVHQVSWPQYDESKLELEEYMIAIQVDGKVRGELKVSRNESEDSVKERAQSFDRVRALLQDKNIQKIIYVPGKLVSIATQKR